MGSISPRLGGKSYKGAGNGSGNESSATSDLGSGVRRVSGTTSCVATSTGSLGSSGGSSAAEGRRSCTRVGLSVGKDRVDDVHDTVVGENVSADNPSGGVTAADGKTAVSHRKGEVVARGGDGRGDGVVASQEARVSNGAAVRASED